jgi:hypothetical protein
MPKARLALNQLRHWDAGRTLKLIKSFSLANHKYKYVMLTHNTANYILLSLMI